MLNPFKRNRLIHRLAREQTRLLDEELSSLLEGKLSEPQMRHVEGHIARIKNLTQQIMPMNPLDWVSAMVRTGVAIILFLLLVAPPYSYLRAHYLSPVIASVSSASGTAMITDYIPEVPVSVAQLLWQRRDTGGPIEVDHTPKADGMAVGVAPQMLDGAMGEAFFWTEAVGGKHVIKKLVTDEYFRPTKTTSSTLWDDHDYVSAAVTVSGTTSLVVGAYQSQGPRVVLQVFDQDGKIISHRVDVTLGDGESADDIQALPWGNEWAIVSRKPRGPDDKLFDPSHVEVRVFDSSLNQLGKLEFALSGYEIGSFPLVVRTLDGYSVIATAHPSVRTSLDTGDRLFAFQYDADRRLYRVLRLTDNGGQHDFQTTGYAMMPDGSYAIGVQNLPAPSFEDQRFAYPQDSGRSYIRFFDPAFQIAGAFIIFDDRITPDTLDKRGVAHVRQTLIGNRLYQMYDTYSSNGTGDGGPSRSVQVLWAGVSHGQ